MTPDMSRKRYRKEKIGERSCHVFKGNRNVGKKRIIRKPSGKQRILGKDHCGCIGRYILDLDWFYVRSKKPVKFVYVQCFFIRNSQSFFGKPFKKLMQFNKNTIFQRSS